MRTFSWIHLKLEDGINIGEKVTDYGEENPLLMDYYGFIPEVRLPELFCRLGPSLYRSLLP